MFIATRHFFQDLTQQKYDSKVTHRIFIVLLFKVSIGQASSTTWKLNSGHKIEYIHYKFSSPEMKPDFMELEKDY